MVLRRISLSGPLIFKELGSISYVTSRSLSISIGMHYSGFIAINKKNPGIREVYSPPSHSISDRRNASAGKLTKMRSPTKHPVYNALIAK